MGVPSSGDVPKSWTKLNYDPRRSHRNPKQFHRLSTKQNNDEHTIEYFTSSMKYPPPLMFTSSTTESPDNFVTPVTKKSTQKPRFILSVDNGGISDFLNA